MGDKHWETCLCISSTFPTSLCRTVLACLALSHPTATQVLVRGIPELADMGWCDGITVQSASVIGGWPCAKCRSVMFAEIQGMGFSYESTALEQHSTDKCPHYSHSGQDKCLRYLRVDPWYIEENIYLYCLLSHSAVLCQVYHNWIKYASPWHL